MSRFIQGYKKHLDEAEKVDGTIVLHQRGGHPTWVLVTETRAQAQQEAAEYATLALDVVVHDEAALARFVDRLGASLPWMLFLPEGDRETFATEATETLRACASIGKYTAFTNLLDDWRNTAEIWSDPSLAASLSGDVDEPLDLRA